MQVVFQLSRKLKLRKLSSTCQYKLGIGNTRCLDLNIHRNVSFKCTCTTNIVKSPLHIVSEFVVLWYSRISVRTAYDNWSLLRPNFTKFRHNFHDLSTSENAVLLFLTNLTFIVSKLWDLVLLKQIHILCMSAITQVWFNPSLVAHGWLLSTRHDWSRVRVALWVW